jgi:hypothetical protein
MLADGYQLDGLTVTGGGSVTLSGGRTASKVTIGLGYAARIKLLRPELRGAPTAQGLRKRAIRLFARVIDTLGLSFFDAQSREERLFDRSLDTVMNTPPTLRNGDSENISIGGGSEMELDCELVSDDAFPCMISMVVPTYDIEELNK